LNDDHEEPPTRVSNEIWAAALSRAAAQAVLNEEKAPPEGAGGPRGTSGAMPGERQKRDDAMAARPDQAKAPFQATTAAGTRAGTAAAARETVRRAEPEMSRALDRRGRPDAGAGVRGAGTSPRVSGAAAGADIGERRVNERDNDGARTESSG
jgi:hypothetical protein